MNNETETIRVHIWISGRVQGVCFRMYTCDEAMRLGLSGWVRNLPDGRVEAVFEGDRHQVDQAVAWCHHGPRHACVMDVELVVEPSRGKSTGFTTRF